MVFFKIRINISFFALPHDLHFYAFLLEIYHFCVGLMLQRTHILIFLNRSTNFLLSVPLLFFLLMLASTKLRRWVLGCRLHAQPHNWNAFVMGISGEWNGEKPWCLEAAASELLLILIWVLQFFSLKNPTLILKTRLYISLHVVGIRATCKTIITFWI